MQRRVEIKSGSEWISLTEVETDEKPIVEDVKTDAFYSAYPKVERYPDMLPPDYHAILSLLFSVFGICWCVTAIFVVYV